MDNRIVKTCVQVTVKTDKGITKREYNPLTEFYQGTDNFRRNEILNLFKEKWNDQHECKLELLAINKEVTTITEDGYKTKIVKFN